MCRGFLCCSTHTTFESDPHHSVVFGVNTNMDVCGSTLGSKDSQGNDSYEWKQVMHSYIKKIFQPYLPLALWTNNNSYWDELTKSATLDQQNLKQFGHNRRCASIESRPCLRQVCCNWLVHLLRYSGVDLHYQLLANINNSCICPWSAARNPAMYCSRSLTAEWVVDKSEPQLSRARPSRIANRSDIKRACRPLPFANAWIQTNWWWNRTAISSSLKTWCAIW